ncbi:MAG: VOC family protein [Pseudomonadota bacterium]
MISYVSVGSNDIGLSKLFYNAILPALGFRLEEGPEGLSYILATVSGDEDEANASPPPPDFYVKPPFDGQPASAGNGSMVAFEASTQQQVRDLHAAALAAGGTDEGSPGFRPSYGPRFYVAYLRDPFGNKIALYSSNPNEPGRDG